MYTGTITDYHDPGNDAKVSIRLFKKYYADSSLKARAQRLLLDTPSQPSWVKRNDYRWEGVCMAAYMPKKCICGAPTLHND